MYYNQVATNFIETYRDSKICMSSLPTDDILERYLDLLQYSNYRQTDDTLGLDCALKIRKSSVPLSTIQANPSNYLQYSKASPLVTNLVVTQNRHLSTLDSRVCQYIASLEDDFKYTFLGHLYLDVCTHQSLHMLETLKNIVTPCVILVQNDIHYIRHFDPELYNLVYDTNKTGLHTIYCLDQYGMGYDRRQAMYQKLQETGYLAIAIIPKNHIHYNVNCRIRHTVEKEKRKRNITLTVDGEAELIIDKSYQDNTRVLSEFGTQRFRNFE